MLYTYGPDMGLFKKTETFEFTVTGMDCGGCERKITTAITKIAGVRQVQATAASGSVTVKAKGVKSSQIKDGIVGAGFGVE